MKKWLTRLISWLPGNRLRCLAYRKLCRYRIHGAEIGWNTWIWVEQATLEGCHIGRHNRFLGPMSIAIGPNTQIDPQNRFECGGAWTSLSTLRHRSYRRRLEIGENCLITFGHYFDCTGELSIGKGTWIAGTGSQFWTHGAGQSDRDIHIGAHCYLGSAVRLAPGSSIGDHTLVGLGTVVTGKFTQSHVVLAGVPAAIIKDNPHFTPIKAER